jgi:hypothetical protein
MVRIGGSVNEWLGSINGEVQQPDMGWVLGTFDHLIDADLV